QEHLRPRPRQVGQP
ncbi:hypothetical protein BN1723_020063, partial [Verticillium longisporum]